MAFTMAELRQELQALGYGSLHDDFIVSSLSQLQLDIPQSRDNIEKGDNGGRSSSSRRVPAAGKSSRQVHGSPVPGDREFAEKMKSTVRGKKELESTALRQGGLDSVCFTPDFATELDEMRKMLRIMQGTKEQLFGSSDSSLSGQRTTGKHFGLADEHQLYVGNLLDQWRVVGRTIRSKRKECAAVNVGVLPHNLNIGAASNSNTRRDHQMEQNHTSSIILENGRRHRGKQHDAAVESKIQPQAKEPSTISRGLERCVDGCYLQADSKSPAAGNNDGNRPAEDECLMGKVETDHHHQEEGATGGTTETDLNEGDLDGFKGWRGVGTGNEKGPVFKRQESSSAISPGVSYQQGGMLYLENFTLDADNNQPDLPSTNEECAPQSHPNAEAEDNPSSPSPRSSAKTPKEVLDKLSALSRGQILATFQKRLDDLDPEDVIDQKTFANVNQKISDATHVSVFCRHILAQQPVVESEKPLELGSLPVLMRTPDRRDGGGAHQSPLNDRSNMRIAEEEDLHVLSHSRTKLKKKTESNSPPALKRNSAVTLKRSRSSREVSGRNEIGEEANYAHLSDIVEGGGQGDSHVLTENRTPPPPGARKFKSERFPRHSLAEKSISPSVTIRNKGVVDASDLDIPALGLSPVRVRDQPASPLNNLLSSRERSCVANGYTEHRLGSHCSACHPPPTLLKSGDGISLSTTTDSKSPFGKTNSETALSEWEASPQQKRSSVRRGAGLRSLSKQKLPLKKSSAAPSGIYTPLIDPKKNDLNINLKVLHKTRRLASSMDFASDNSRLTDRRAPSLRSSTESSRSSGPQRATSSQSQVSKSNSGSSPYAKSSSFGSRSSTPKDVLSSPFGKSSSFASFGSRSATTKDTLTPGGPRRGGKVDRVARFAEMQNLWKNDTFLKTSSKRKPQSFHRIFAQLHLSHERCTAAYRERVLEEMRPSTEQPPFVVPTLYSNSEGVCSF